MALENRSAIYASPGLSAFRASKVNVKLQQLLRRIEQGEGVDGTVKATVDGMKGPGGTPKKNKTGDGAAGDGDGDGDGAKRKPKVKKEAGAGRKRKIVKVELESDELEDTE